MKRPALNLLLISFSAVTILTLILLVFLGRFPYGICFYLLYPGEVLGMFIGGPHGGTLSQEWEALIVSVVVNTAVYWLLFTLLRAVWQGLRARANDTQSQERAAR